MRTGLTATPMPHSIAVRGVARRRTISNTRSAQAKSAADAGKRIRVAKENPSPVRWSRPSSIQPASGGWL